MSAAVVDLKVLDARMAVLLPACLGVWLTLPSIEALIVPGAYRGPFRHFLTLMLPGLFAMTYALFAINPIFQIANRTAPIIAAALIGCFADAALGIRSAAMAIWMTCFWADDRCCIRLWRGV